ncbi:AAA family ATPase [Myxosarcina sp. GI1]|uniref:AAA family ATPase n=1 Tax=Myxosarcina sp. GI1 TaxID=1541065 RepID=UPI00055D02BA|nr:AAA family ATPase [Myxosarcina sp. GI1]
MTIALPDITVKTQIYESANSLVYRAVRRTDNTAVVLKVLKQDYPTTAELIRYKQEYEITRSLNLEGVIKAYSQQNYQRTSVIILEDFGGDSLQKLKESKKISCPMSLAEFLRLAIAITEILGTIHVANVIHKDINPGNIVLNLDTGVVKIIDFGIATRFNRINPTFKNPYGLEGTLAYLSPEQTGRMNRLLDYRTDFYSLGVTFYELLTGHLPFSTSDILELVHCHLAKQPPPLHEIKAEIPQLVSDIILKLMAKNAENRYQSAWGIKADLETCLRQFSDTGRIAPIQLGRQDVSEQFQISQKLYGREAEIGRMLAAFDRVASSGNKEMMLVSGYAGIGKSALIREIYKPVTEKRGYFISGKFDQLQRNIPYSAIAAALQKLVQQLLGESEARIRHWRSQLLSALGNNGQIIIDVIPEVELIINKQPPVPEVGATEAQNRFNRIFQSFVRVFCSREHPLVIFLDDLQWIDSATLKLIELMLLDEQNQFLFLIGAYRDNEVSPTHPLILTCNRLRKQEAILQEIVLTPLKLESLSQLIAETMNRDAGFIRPLAQLVLQKTEGNPFFVNEFLRMLHSENLLTFIPPQSPLSKGSHSHARVSPIERSGVGSKGGWQWNIARIQAQNITDNVVELMLFKLKKLPEASQQILRLAACIGAEFDLDTLSLVAERSPKLIFHDLLTAIQNGLIQPLSELDENLLVRDYKFAHDRIQQAAHALIDESQKQVIYLQIGRKLLANTSPEQKSERLFETVDCLNRGIELVTEQSERNEIARLNLMAAQKAKAAIAYSMAKKYLIKGRECLTDSSWQTNYDLTLNCYTETTEVAYLCGKFEDVETWAAIVLQQAKTILDRVKIYEVKIQAFIAHNQLVEAIDTGLQVLQQLGIEFPKNPIQSEIRLELDAIASAFDEKAIADLIYLPKMTDPDKLAAMRILSKITIAAYIAAPDLMPLLVSQQVNLSINYGNTSVSPFAYATLGMILCGMLGKIESGYEFGQLALRLLSQPNSDALRARTSFIVHNCIIHWKEHLRKISQPLQEAYQHGLETGDLEFAAYCAHTYCFQFYVSGKELVEVERNIAIYGEAIRQIKQETVLAWSKIYRQAIANLMGRSLNSYPLIGEFYNEEKELPQHQAVNDGIAIFDVYFNKLFLCYLFSEYSQAVENSNLAESYLIRTTSTPLEALYYLYDSLARLAIYFETSTQAKAEILKKIAINQEKIRQWADYAPMNHLHKYHLVRAELARVSGQLFEAEEFYEQAIQGAKENGYIQEEALAYELAAKFYLSRGREKFAQTYMKEALYCYERWGASAKVKDLEARYPQFFLQASNRLNPPIFKSTESTSNSSEVAFDLAAVLKASQVISSEIELERLLDSLMKILIENAGAQSGFLILEDSGEWAIEASCACEFNNNENNCVTQILQSLSITNNLPESIINYVIRTHKSVILNDASREDDFIHDPYIQKDRTRSLFCLPLLDRGKLVGVLYLENQLATGAFTPERAQVLNLLSTQAAIAIENARLYSKLRASESRIAQFLEAVPVGIVAVDSTGYLNYFNQRAIQLLGRGIDSSLVPKRISEVYQLCLAGTKRPYPTEELPGIRALKGECSTVDDVEIHQNDTKIPVEVWGTPVFDERGEVIYAIASFQDITERKQAEQILAEYNQTLERQVAERTLELEREQAALRQSEATNRAMIDAIPDLLIQMSQDGTYLKVVKSGNFQPFNPQQLKTGVNIHNVLPPSIARERMEYVQKALQTRELQVYEQKIVDAERVYDQEVRIVANGDSQVLVMIRDIRDRKQAEEASILEERNRMAREIHDTLAQAFTGIIVHLDAASQRIELAPDAARSHLKTVRILARSGLADARRSVEALRPQILEEGDLPSALERFTTQMFADTTVRLVCEASGEPYPLPKEVETNLLRIGQEALTNVFKHAKASEICVQLRYKPAQFVLRIKDNGQGFENSSLLVGRGFGLLGMTERAERIGAELTIQSHIGRGTEITVKIQTP